MKKENIKYLSILIISVIVSSVVSVTATVTLFNSSEVVYDNHETNLNASNVQDAIDILYAAATDYSDLSSRLLAVENNFYQNKLVNNQGIELNNNGILSGFGGYIDFHYSGDSADYTSRIIESASGKIQISATSGIELNTNVATDRGIQIGKNASGSYGYADWYYAGNIAGNVAPGGSSTLNVAAWKNGNAGTGTLNLNGDEINLKNANNNATVKVNNSSVVTDATKTSFKLTTGVSGVGFGTNECYKVGAIHTCQAWLSGFTSSTLPATSEVAIADVPAAYRPSTRVWCGLGYVGNLGTNASNFYGFIKENGQVIVRHGGNLTSVMITCTWVK